MQTNNEPSGALGDRFWPCLLCLVIAAVCVEGPLLNRWFHLIPPALTAVMALALAVLLLGIASLALLLRIVTRRLADSALSARELCQCLVILLLALAVRMPFMPTQGYPADTESYAAWSWKAASMGIHTLYEKSEGVTCDNHPLILYSLKIIGKIHERLTLPACGTPDQPTPLLLFLLRIPAVIADLLMGVMVYAWARRFLSHTRSALVMALLVFNVAVFCDSALYGQVDSIHSLLVLTAVILLDRGRYGWSWSVMGLAMMAKPQTYVLIPLLIIVTFRRFGWRALATGGLACVGSVVLVASPFIWRGTPLSLAQYMLSITTIHPMVSMNADNFWWWATGGQAASIRDTAPAIGQFLSYRLYGIILLLLLHVPVWCRVWQTPRSPGILAWAAVSVIVFFNVATQMHETYLYLALPFLAMTCLLDRRFAVLYALVSLTFAANVALHFPSFVAWLTPSNPDVFGGSELFLPRFAVSVLNTAIMIWILWSLERTTIPESPGPTWQAP